MLPPAIVRRSGTPDVRAAATSNASSRHFASISACVGRGGLIAPTASPVPMLSVIARSTESNRTGRELRVKPTTALATGAPAVARGALFVSTNTGTTPGGLADNVSGGGGTADSGAGDATTARESACDDEPRRWRGSRSAGAGARGMEGLTNTSCSDSCRASRADVDADGLVKRGPSAPRTMSADPTVKPAAAAKAAPRSTTVG